MFGRKSWIEKQKDNEPDDPAEKFHYWNELSIHNAEKAARFGKWALRLMALAVVLQVISLLMRFGWWF